MQAANDSEALLEAALSESFSPPPTRRHSVPPAKYPTPAEASSGTSLEPKLSSDTEPSPDTDSVSDSTWKSIYEDQVKVWRMQSAEAREKAERERKKWEDVREREGPSPADSRDLVSGEMPKTQINTESESQHSRKTTSEADDAASKQWEHVDPSSLASSLPSMSFPEDPASTQNQTQTPAPPAPAPAQVTTTTYPETPTIIELVPLWDGPASNPDEEVVYHTPPTQQFTFQPSHVQPYVQPYGTFQPSAQETSTPSGAVRNKEF